MAKKKTGIHAPLIPSDELAEIVGDRPIARTEVTKKIWVYIKKNKLQDKKDGRIIIPDKKLSVILGKKPISMLKMPGKIGKHLFDE